MHYVAVLPDSRVTTTYECSISWIDLSQDKLPDGLDVSVAMLVVDEAHYAKNPNALRTQAVSEWAARSRRVMFLTGTPMENKVAEFRVLVGHLRPEVAEKLDLGDESMDGTRFREKVAPVYLRRNQEDVLSELPARLETQEWVALEGVALRAYRNAVLTGTSWRCAGPRSTRERSRDRRSSGG